MDMHAGEQKKYFDIAGSLTLAEQDLIEINWSSPYEFDKAKNVNRPLLRFYVGCNFER